MRDESVNRLRDQSWALLHEISGYILSEQMGRMQRILVKYRADQARVPGGNPEGGQWTSDGTNGVSASQVLNSVADIQNNSNNGLSYPDGSPVIDPNTGEPYPAPEGMDILKNIKFASAFAHTAATEFSNGVSFQSRWPSRLPTS